MSNREIAAEQREITKRYQRLDALRAETASLLANVRRAGPSGSPQNRSERDSFSTHYEDRLAQLNAVEERLVFGHLSNSDGSQRYIGRIGLSDEEHNSLLTDWRTQAAEPFYRATAAHPLGVERRRHIVTKNRKVTALEDDVLDLDAVRRSPDQLIVSGLSGEGALLAAMTEGRTGQMGDIVATIQAEQDQIIRDRLDGVLVVQGGPGTGKTAVALHRAAYLLHRHRDLLAKSGVLLIGPSQHFLNYIDQVLPSLGETGVVSTTLANLLPGVRAKATDSDRARQLKGDLKMVQVLERAIRARQRVPQRNIKFRLDSHDLVIKRSDVSAAIAKARTSGKPHNLARRVFVKEMLSRLGNQYVKQLELQPSPEDYADILTDLRETALVRRELNLAWFPLTPEGLVSDLWHKPHRLAEAAPHLSIGDRQELFRPKESAQEWSVDDVPLLDEAAELLGVDNEQARRQRAAQKADRAAEVEFAEQVLKNSGAGWLLDAKDLANRFADSGPYLSTAERAISDRTWAYGHIIVDEAQELSLMAWRMLARRVPTRSMTVVGDTGQTTNPAGPGSWEASIGKIFRDYWRKNVLTISYRTPAEIVDASQRFAQAAGLTVSDVTAARTVPGSLLAQQVPAEDLVLAAVGQTQQALAAIAKRGAGTAAIILPESLAAAVAAALAENLPDGDFARLSVLRAEEAKGLEYDEVIVVEPALFAQRTPGALYVALTRATQQLRLVHSESLPAKLLK